MEDRRRQKGEEEEGGGGREGMRIRKRRGMEEVTWEEERC